MRRWIVRGLVAGGALLCGHAAADSELKGWVTRVDPAGQIVDVGGQTLRTAGMRVTGGTLEPGVFVEVERGRIKVKPQRPPADDQIIRFSVKGPENPGRSEFSHLRHFNALGDKQCKTCHSPEMGLLTSPSYASRAADPAWEPHGPKSLGRYCATCHNGTTRLSQVGTPGGRPNAPIFTAAKTGDPKSCQRCHAPADHGADFTPAHGDIVEKTGERACLACHSQDWGARDRRLHSELLAAEKVLGVNPDDPKAALAVGPNNFCVYCHRTDSEWR
jgi:Cytochrome c7 and related cytochrome c